MFDEGVLHHQKHNKEHPMHMETCPWKIACFSAWFQESVKHFIAFAFDSDSETAMEIDTHRHSYTYIYTYVRAYVYIYIHIMLLLLFCGALGSEFHLRRWLHHKLYYKKLSVYYIYIYTFIMILAYISIYECGYKIYIYIWYTIIIYHWYIEYQWVSPVLDGS